MAYNVSVKRKTGSKGHATALPAPVVAGVYFLFLADELTYVGQSRDCYKRIGQHRVNGRPFDFATVMPLALELIGKVETALIKGFDPPQNVTHTDSLKSHREARRLTRPTETREPREVPACNGLGTVSRGPARDIAVAHGLPGAVIDEAIADHRLLFVDSGRKGGRSGSPVVIARYADVVAFCERERSARLAAMGLGAMAPPPPALLPSSPTNYPSSAQSARLPTGARP